VHLSTAATSGVAPPRYSSSAAVATKDAHFARWHIDELRVGETIAVDALFGVTHRVASRSYAQLEARVVSAAQPIAEAFRVHNKRLTFFVGKQH
jgi:hypothetical protein